MILKRLRLNNFRCYAGSVELSFATDATQNVTVINGTNGTGKTSILHALYFVLYGRGAVTTDSPLIHREALKLGSERYPAKTSVILEFSDKGTEYSLQRRLLGYYVGDRVHYVRGEADECSLTYVSSLGNTEREPFPDQRIEQMLPSAIKTFFLFDGDRISDFSRPGRERDVHISKAVNDVLHIEALTRAVNHTSDIADKKKKAVMAAAPPSVAQTSSDIKLQELAVERKQENVSSLQSQERETSEEVATLDQQLSAIISIAQASKQRRDLERKRDALIANGSELRRQLAKATIAAIPALASLHLAGAYEILGRYKSRHEIPARIADHFLRELIHRKECICGRTIADDESAREHLETLLASLLPDSLQDTATDLLGKLRPMIRESSTLPGSLIAGLRQISTSDDEITKVDRELQRLGGDIDVAAIDGAEVLNRKRVEASRRLNAIKEARPRSERELELAQKHLKLLEERLKTESAKRESLRQLNDVWTTAKECSELLTRAKALLEARLRASLTLEATDIMKKLASDSKSYFFAEIKVDEGFILRVIDHQGEDVRPQLSMGETQVSSLSFMLAMTRLGGQEAPLVIDTPLARLDKSVRVNFARWLPDLTRQLVLLVTDAEFESAVRDTIASRVGATYELQPSVAGTRIVQGLHA